MKIKDFSQNARSDKHILLTESYLLLSVLLSQLMSLLEKTKYQSVSQTYGLCSALLDRSIRAGIFYGSVTPPLRDL